MLASAVLGVLLTAASPAPPSVLVLPLRVHGQVNQDTAVALSAALLLEVGRVASGSVVGLREVETSVAHEELRQLADCETDACALQIAGALNADQIISGTLSVVGTQLVLAASRTDARTAAVAARVLERCPADRPEVLLDRMPALAHQLMGTPAAPVPPARPAPAAAVVQPPAPTAPVRPAPRQPAAAPVEEPLAETGGNQVLGTGARVLFGTGACGVTPGACCLLASLPVGVGLQGCVSGLEWADQDSRTLSAGALVVPTLRVASVLGTGLVAVAGLCCLGLGGLQWLAALALWWLS